MLRLFCDRDRIRTCDRLLRRQMLYPAELRDHSRINYVDPENRLLQKAILFTKASNNFL